MDLEVQMERRPLRVACIADETDDVARVHLAPVHRERRERREVRVVEEISLAVAEPEPVSADLVPPHREKRPGSNRQKRRAERGEDVSVVVTVARVDAL